MKKIEILQFEKEDFEKLINDSIYNALQNFFQILI